MARQDNNEISDEEFFSEHDGYDSDGVENFFSDVEDEEQIQNPPFLPAHQVHQQQLEATPPRLNQQQPKDEGAPVRKRFKQSLAAGLPSSCKLDLNNRFNEEDDNDRSGEDENRIPTAAFEAPRIQ